MGGAWRSSWWGVYMVGFLGLIVLQNMQLEGLFFYFCTGVFSGAIIHYSNAKLFGPLIFGRGFCGWACWTAMVIDLLPYHRSKGWIPGPWKWLRYVHFALSLGMVAMLVIVFGYQPQRLAPVWWLLIGNFLYYASALPMAYLLRDNRAFCKYLCPVPVLMKLSSRFALLKIAGVSERCDQCMACVKVCPMDIRIPDYVLAGERVLSTECILCQTCVSACPTTALAVSWGLDVGGGANGWNSDKPGPWRRHFRLSAVDALPASEWRTHPEECDSFKSTSRGLPANMDRRGAPTDVSGGSRD